MGDRRVSEGPKAPARLVQGGLEVKRLSFCGSILVLALVACASSVVGQELSDGERLKHGIDLYNNMKYQEAIQVLKEIDPSKLPEFDRTSRPST